MSIVTEVASESLYQYVWEVAYALLKLLVALFLIVHYIRLMRDRFLNDFRDKKNVCVVVLGDIGRSPRMQHHVMTAIAVKSTVDVIGYSGSPPLQDILNNPLVKIHNLRPVPQWFNKLPSFLGYILKAIWQSVDLLLTLFCKRIPEVLVMQNPPAVPTMPLCWFYCALTRTRFVIDWHNYAYTIMALKLGNNHILTKLTRFIEMRFGRQAAMNVCVTKYMKQDLKENYHITSEVMYDEAGKDFHTYTKQEIVEVKRALQEKYNLPLSDSTALVVSSTSWTEDEDFSILIDALQEYEDTRKNKLMHLPNLVCVITGKGPLKEFYEAIIALKKWKYVTVRTVWLDNEDYPKILACANLGVCLHTSSSGLDFPMKVVDMISCWLPTCAYEFQGLSNIIDEKDTGLVFSNAKELARQLTSWFNDFLSKEHENKRVNTARKAFISLKSHANWNNTWTQHVLPGSNIPNLVFF